jgi:hypothetical protein
LSRGGPAVAVVSMISEPFSHYYQVITRSKCIPVLIEKRL